MNLQGLKLALDFFDDREHSVNLVSVGRDDPAVYLNSATRRNVARQWSVQRTRQ